MSAVMIAWFRVIVYSWLKLFVKDADNGLIVTLAFLLGNVWLAGRPRDQEAALKAAGVGIDFVVDIETADEEILRRMSGRRVHLPSGRTYHVEFNPPKVAGKDDVTGEPLVQRPDDLEETVRKRIDTYHLQTKPLVDFYRNQTGPGAARYVRIDGVGAVESIRDSIFAALG